MKNLILAAGLISFAISLQAQTFSTNETPVGMEHNVLFNAEKRFKVTQTGGAALDFNKLFDGKFEPSYTSTAPTVGDPTVILIENLPKIHTQLGAWVGWSTRYWPTNRFKIEAYNTYETEEWVVVADYSNNDYEAKANYNIKLPRGRYTKLRYTFYSATGTYGRLGISELFFIHPEAVSPYEGLFTSGGTSTNGLWEKNAEGISYTGGNVGIGISKTNPNFKLEVAGTAKVGNGDWGALIIDGKDRNDWMFNAHNGGTALYIRTQRDGEDSGSNFVMTMMRETGNVGIGTSDTKGYKLAVEGKILGSTLSTSDGNAKGEFFTYSKNQNLYLGAGKDKDGNKNEIILYNLSCSDGCNVPRIQLLADKVYTPGNVGIGTTDTKGYKLAVAGKVIAEEVKVELQTNWPDYVFEENYDLPSLEETENYIKENGHLQNIPSAEEVAEEGISLGEMNASMLRKIEELWLHVIDLKKENDLLKVEVKTLLNK